MDNDIDLSIFDAHSHIGKDLFFRLEGTIEEYIESALKAGIDGGLLMPCPCPVITSEGKSDALLFWERSNGIRAFWRVSDYQGRAVKTPVISNPYREANEMIRKVVESSKAKGKFYFVPLVHLLLDEPKYVQSLLEHKPTAIKIHGISAGISPEEADEKLMKIIKKSEVPLIVHTDYEAESENKSALGELRRENSAKNWVKLLRKYKIRAMLAHGARLCPETIETVNNDDSFVIGIAPDLLMDYEEERLIITETPYLEKLFSMVNSKRLVFDLDYPWNIVPQGGGTLDFSAQNRIRRLVNDETVLQRIFSLNAKKIFEIS